MINDRDHPVAWYLLMTELSDTQEHIEDVVNQMAAEGQICETDFESQIAHIYAHLNRAWNSRNESRHEVTEAEWTAQSEFPTDIKPI